MPACDEGTAPAKVRNWPSQGQGRGMPAGDEGAAPASAWPRAEGSHLRGGKEDAGLRAGNSPTSASPWTGISHLRVREQGWGLASREQPQRVRDHGPDSAIRGSENKDGGVTMDRNWPSQGKGARMPACDEGTPPARDRNEPCGAEGRGMPACNLKQAAGMGHRWEGHEGCRLGKRGQSRAGRGIGHLRVTEPRRRLVVREQPQPGQDGGQALAISRSAKRMAAGEERAAPS